MQKSIYYKEEFNKIKQTTQYAPTVKIFANGNGECKDTNHISLNTESATELIEYLALNYLNNESLKNVINALNNIPSKF
jgi:hypothetical protein